MKKVGYVIPSFPTLSETFIGDGTNIYYAPKNLANNLKASDFVCAVSQDMQKELQLATGQPVLHIPYGIHSPDYPSLEKHWHPDKDFLFIGCLVEKKGLEMLLPALKPLGREASLNIVGDGPLRAKLKQQADQLKPNQQITFHDSKDASLYRLHARSYKALAVPFTRAANGDKDTASLVIKEAMVLGLPVIAHDLADYREVLNNQNGIQVPMDAPISLGKAMLHHLSLTAQRHSHR